MRYSNVPCLHLFLFFIFKDLFIEFSQNTQVKKYYQKSKTKTKYKKKKKKQKEKKKTPTGSHNWEI